MIGKFLKTLIVLVLGMVLGVGAIIGGLVAGVATVATQPLGQVAGMLLGDDTDKYLSEDAQDDTLSDAIGKITEIMQDGTVADLEQYIPYIGTLLAGLGENEMLNSLVNIDMDRLGETKFSSLMSFNLSEIMDAVEITANLESVLSITGITLNDFGFGFVEDLSVYSEDGYYEQEITLGELFAKATSDDLTNSEIDLYKVTTANGKTVYERVPYKNLKRAELSKYYKFVGKTDISNYFYKASETQYNPMFEETSGGNITVLNAPALNKTAYRRYQALSKAPIMPIDGFIDTVMTRLFDITYRDLEIALNSLMEGTGMDFTKVLEGLLPPVEEGSTQLKTLDDATIGDILQPLNIDFIRIAPILEGIGMFDPNAPTGDNMIGDIISLVAYDSASNPRTLENVLESLMDEVMVKDLIECIPLNLEEIEGLLDLILLDKNGNKLSINGVLENIKDIQNTLYTADVFDALELTMFEDGGSFYDLACLLAYQDGNPDNTDVNNKLTIAGTIEKLRNFKDIKVIDVINAVGVNLSDFQGVIDLIAYKDPKGDLTDKDNQRSISEAITYLKHFGDIYTVDIIEAIDMDLSGIQKLIDLFVYDDLGNKLTIYETLDRARGFVNLYAADIIDAIDIDFGELKSVVNLLIYKNIDGDLTDDNNKYTVNDVIAKVGDLQNAFKTVDVVNALDDFVTILNNEDIRELLDTFMYGDVDGDGVEDELTVGQTIEKALDFDKYLYTADIINVLDINLITGDGQFAGIVNLLAYKDPDGDLTDDANKYLVTETIDLVGNIQNEIKTIDVVDALEFVTILSDEDVRKVINIFAYDNPDGDLNDKDNKLSIAETINKAKDFDENLYTADIVNMLDIGLITGDGQFAGIVNLLAYKDVDGDLNDDTNKYTVSETINVIGNIQNEIKTIDVVNALEFVTILSDEDVRKVINIFAYDDPDGDLNDKDNKLSIAGTINKAKDFDENLYTADIVNMLDIGLITGDGQFAGIVNLLAYKDVDGDLNDDANKYTVSETINVIGNIQNEIKTIDVVDALEFVTILSDEDVRKVINIFAYDDPEGDLNDKDNKLSIAETINKAKDFDENLYTADIVNMLDIGLITGDGQFAGIVNLLAYKDVDGDLNDDTNKYTVSETINVIGNIQNEIKTIDVVDALEFVTILSDEDVRKVINTFSYDDPDGDLNDKDNKLSIAETINKAKDFDENLYTADIVNMLDIGLITGDGQFAGIVNLIAYRNPEGDLNDDANKYTVSETINVIGNVQNELHTIDVVNALDFITILSDEDVREIINTFSYADGDETNTALSNKLTIAGTIEKALAFDQHLYTADVVNALNVDILVDDGMFAKLVNLVAYKDPSGNLEDDANKLTINATLEKVFDFKNSLHTQDVIDALDFITILHEDGMIKDFVSLITYGDPDGDGIEQKLTIGETIEKTLAVGEFYTIDLVNATNIDLLVGEGELADIIKLIALKDPEGDADDIANKLTVSETIKKFKDFQNEFYTIDVINATGLTMFEEPAIKSIVNTFAYEDGKETGAKLTIAETIDKITHILDYLYTADLIDATGIAFLNEGAVGNILDIFSYHDPKGDLTDDENKLTLQETIDKVLAITDLYTADFIVALEVDAIVEGGKYAFLIDPLTYKDVAGNREDDANKYTIGETISRIPDVYDIYKTLDIIDAFGLTFLREGIIGNVVDIIATTNGERLTLKGTVDKVINFTSLYTADIVNAFEVESLQKDGKFAFLIDPLAYKDVAGNREDDANKYTISETISRIPDVYDIYKTLDIIDAFGLTFLREGIIGNVVDIIATTDGERLTLKGTVDKVINFTSLYTADIVNAFEVESLQKDGKFAFLIDPLAYKDVAGNREDDANKYTISETISRIPDVYDIYKTLDIIDAFGLTFLREGIIGNVVDIIAITDGERLTLKGTVDKVINFTSLYTADIIDAFEIDALKEGGDYAFFVDAIAFKDGDRSNLADGNKLTVGESIDHVLNNFLDIFYTADLVGVVEGFVPALGEGPISGIIDVFCYEDTNGDHNDIENKYTLRETIETAKEALDKIKTIDVVDSLGIDMLREGALGELVDILCYDDPLNKTEEGKLTIRETIEVAKNFQDHIYTAHIAEITGLTLITGDGQFAPLFNLIAYKDGDPTNGQLSNKYTVGQSIDMLLAFDSTFYTYEIVEALNIDILNEGGRFHDLVTIVAYEDGTTASDPLLIGGTIDKVINFADTIPVLDVIDALDMIEFSRPVQQLIELVGVNKEGKRLTVNEALEYFYTLKVGEVCDALEFALEDFGLCGPGSVAELTVEEVIRNAVEENDLWYILDRVDVAGVLEASQGSDILDGAAKYIALNRLSTEYLASIGYTLDADNRVLDLVIYDEEGALINFEQREEEYITFDKENDVWVEGRRVYIYNVDKDEYVYEAYSQPIASPLYAIRDSVKASDLVTKINTITIGELIDGYTTAKRYELMRAIISPSTTLSKIMSGDAVREITLVDVLGESKVASNKILYAISYYPGGSKVLVSDLTTRINHVQVGEIVDGYDGVRDTLLEKVLPYETLITEIGSVDFVANIQSEVTLGEVLGSAAFENNIILSALGQETLIGDIANEINGITIDQVIENYGTGNTELLAKIIDSGTPITEIGTIDIGARIDELTLDELGITFEYQAGNTPEQNATVDVLNHLLTVRDEYGNETTEMAKVGELSETLQENLPLLPLEEFLAMSGGAGTNSVLNALVEKGTTIGTLAEDIKGLMLRDFIDANIMEQITMEEFDNSAVGSSMPGWYAFDDAIYYLYGDESGEYYELANAGTAGMYFNMNDGKYYYSIDNWLAPGETELTPLNGPIEGVDYTHLYRVNPAAKVWFLVFADLINEDTTNDPDVNALEDGYKTSVEYGAYEYIRFGANYNATLDEVGTAVNVAVTNVKIKLLVDLGMFDTSKLSSAAAAAIHLAYDVDFVTMVEETIANRLNP